MNGKTVCYKDKRLTDVDAHIYIYIYINVQNLTEATKPPGREE